MKNRAFALSVVLLMLALVAIPGQTFCISSSVTSYNNTITVIESGGGGDGDPSNISITGSSFKIAENPDPNLGNGYEICLNDNDVFSDGSAKSVVFTATSNCSIQVYVKASGMVNSQIYINGGDAISGLPYATGEGFVSPSYTLIPSPDQSPGAWTAELKTGDVMTITAQGSGSVKVALVFV